MLNSTTGDAGGTTTHAQTGALAGLSFGWIILTGGRCLRLRVGASPWVSDSTWMVASAGIMIPGLPSRESMVVPLTTIGALGRNLHAGVTTGLSTDMNQLFTGDNSTMMETIDKNLAYTQLAVAAIDTVQVAPGDTETAASKARAQTFGTASAPMAAAAMLLLYNIALALEIGLAPLFVLCLIFDQTKGLFHKWLLYSIGTLFSMAVLAFISGLVLQLTLRVAGALWTADIINAILDTGAEGFTSQSMQQGGLGLMMTVLVISAPPMAAMLFQGTLGSFMAYAPFAGGASSQPGSHGQPPGTYGYGGGGYALSQPTTGQGNAGMTITDSDAYNRGARGTIVASQAMADVMKYKPGS